LNLKHLISELKRRNIFRVAAAYAIAGWLIIQVCTSTFPYLNLPEWLITAVIVFVLIGFPITLIIAWAFELTPEGLKKTKEVSADESITDKTGKKLNRIIISILSVTILFLLGERIFFAESTFGDAGRQVTAEEASIAVLPFVNMSSDKENEYFSDGLSEELLNALARVEDMKVAGRTSSFKFKGQNEDLKKIGQQLGVSRILEGSVRKAGNQVRITAQLINVETGYHLWSDTYDRELKDIFAIQEEISRKVLNELKVRLLPEEDQTLADIPTQDIEAYQAYLKANQLVVNRNYDEIEAAIELYKTAIRLDPGFAAAHANLALAYNSQGYYGNIPFEEMQQNIKSYTDQALALNDQSAAAYAALGNYYLNESKPEMGLEMLLKSNELNPNFIDNYNWIGNVYDDLGKTEEQMEWYRKGYEIDPLNPLAIYNRIRVSLYEEDYEEMESFMEKNKRINPDFVPTYFLQGFIQFVSPFGRFDEAFKNFHRAHALDPNFPRTISNLVYITGMLDLEPLTDFYLNKLKENYNQSFEYRNALGFYGTYKENYSLYEEAALRYLNETGIVPQQPIPYFDMYEYAMATGNIDRVTPYFEAFDASLLADTLTTLTRRNGPQAAPLTLLLEKNGNTRQAEILRTAYCDFADRSSGWLKNGTEDDQYLVNRANCALLNKDYEAMYTFMKPLYEEHRDINYLNSALDNLKNYYPEGYTAETEKLHEEIQADLKAQRANAIAYLKEQGEWQEVWGTEIKNEK